MRSRTLILFRAHTKRLKTDKSEAKPKKSCSVPKWPDAALVIDFETTTDTLQAMTFGFARYCRNHNGSYASVQEVIIAADDLPETDPDGLALLKATAAKLCPDTPAKGVREIDVLTRSEFMEQIFWPAAQDAGALIVGFNLPFDLTRLAVDCRAAKKKKDGWSLVMSQDIDPDTGKIRDNPFRSRIRVKPKDSKAAFISASGVGIRSRKSGRRIKPYRPVPFLDLRTLGWALRNESFSLKRACQAFGVPGKMEHEPTGRITIEEIHYCRQDVRATVNVLNAMRIEADLHPIKRPERMSSPASVAKSYFDDMGLIPPSQKFALPDWILGAAMQAYYGGRAECRIRHTIVPTVYTDFLSEYPTVNTLMGLWNVLIADELKIEDATDDVMTMLKA